MMNTGNPQEKTPLEKSGGVFCSKKHPFFKEWM